MQAAVTWMVVAVVAEEVAADGGVGEQIEEVQEGDDEEARLGVAGGKDPCAVEEVERVRH